MSFVPGHISLTFSIWPNKNPLAMGSIGMGVVLPQGVHCAVVKEESDTDENIIIRKGKRIDDPVTLRAIELLGFNNKGLTIYLRHDLPLGSGFGISGASALAACLELEKDLDLCVKAAHQAEIEFKTGLGDVIAIATSLKNHMSPSIVVRHEPGYSGQTSIYPINEKFIVCISGLGRETSEIISDNEWVEIINSAALGIQFNEVSIRSAIKIGRLFTEKSGLINKNISEIFDSTPIGSVCTVAHLGTSIIAISDDLLKLSESLEKFGEIRKY
jgi:pantoate kinase